MTTRGGTPHGEVLPGVLRTQLKAILERDAEADAIALVWPEPLSKPVVETSIEGRAARFVFCASELAMREALVSHSGQDKLVILSPFHQGRLGRDVLARIWGNEPHQIHPWRTLQQFTGVSAIDPRLTEKGRWMAEALLDCFDRYRGHVEFGEVLDLDSAWLALARGYLNYHHDTLELPELLKWSLENPVHDWVVALPSSVREHLGDWLSAALPGISQLIEILFRQDQVQDLMALGLVCSVMTDNAIQTQKLVESEVVYAARGRFVERFLGGETVHQQILARYGESAQQTARGMLASGEFGLLKPALDQAEHILASLDLTPALCLSPLLPGGLNQRFNLFARSLEAGLKKKQAIEAEGAWQRLEQHWLTTVGARQHQLQRAEMALRLLRWCVSGSAQDGAGPRALLEAYLADGSYVDWARSQLWAGEDHEDLNRAYHTLLTKVTEKRERQNQEFARELPAIARGDTLAAHLTPVEQGIERWLAPVAEHGPTLLVVLDGMSVAIYRKLQAELVTHGWVEMTSREDSSEPCLISALPSITKASRCSLLTGRLVSGDASVEKAAFAEHPLLKKIAATRFPPVLLHKQDLQQSGSGALAPDARALIAGGEHRVLGVVINAIDDQLSSSSQVSVDWDFRAVPVLRQVLEAAKEGGRAVILTSDHGHVLDHGTEFNAAGVNEQGERYMTEGRTTNQYEVEVSGPRVLTEDGSAILPWSEKVRYTKARSHGYHGGGSLQEVVIPLGVYLSTRDPGRLVEWREISRGVPSWWSGATDFQVMEPPLAGQGQGTASAGKKAKGKRPEKTALPTQDMFADLEPQKSTEAGQDEEATEADWVKALLRSQIYQQVHSRAGRVPFDDQQLTRFLSLCAEHQGTVMEARVAQAMQIPAIRLRGFLSAMQKLLNVDGYPVLKVDREARTIVLDLNMLKKQFEL